jgi:hypothetical protein
MVMRKCSGVENNCLAEKRVEFRDPSLPGYELGSRGIQLSWQLQNNDKKGIRLCKDNFVCDSKRQ